MRRIAILYFCAFVSYLSTADGRAPGPSRAESGSETTSTSTTSTTTEAPNWYSTDNTYVFYESVQAWYKLHWAVATWYDARDVCAREGGHLAVINSDREAQILKNLLPKNYYGQAFLGFVKRTGPWVTVHGQSLREAGYENWAENQTNKAGGDQYCGGLHFKGVDYVNCNFLIPFICESSASLPSNIEIQASCGTTATGYKYYDKTKTCYKFHTSPDNWHSATITCNEEGGHLLVVNSEAEAGVGALFHGYSNSTVVFVGVLYVNHDEWITHRWESLTEAGYDVWDVGQPKDRMEGSCVVLLANRRLSVSGCYTRQQFICEKFPEFRRREMATLTQAQGFNADTTTVRGTNVTESWSNWTAGSGDVATTTGVEISPKTMSLSEAKTKCEAMEGYVFYENVQGCYKFSRESRTWYGARDACARDGGHLAVANSEGEAQALKELYSSYIDNAFIGFSKTTSPWLPIYGPALKRSDYGAWAGGDPETVNGGRDCGVLRPSGKLADYECISYIPYICERPFPIDAASPATAAPPRPGSDGWVYVIYLFRIFSHVSFVF